MKLVSKNPSKDFEILGEVAETTKEEVVEKVKNAHSIKKEWQDLALNTRIEIINQIHDSLGKNLDKLATLISLEMGMPITQAKDDVSSGLNYLKWYLENAEKYISPEITYEDNNEVHKVFYEPKGVVVSITPWNFPFSNIIWQSCQNLIVGNVVLNKPHPNTPLFNKMLEEIINSSKLPKYTYQFIYGGKEIGQFLVEQDIDMICFTGSTKTGEYLYKVGANKMIPVLMELGGSAPGIVCSDADIDNVVENIFWNKFLNCGQVCDGLKRLIVHESIFDEVVNKLKEVIKRQVIGDALNEKTTIGPLVNKNQLNTLLDQFDDALSKGAKVIIGGKQPNDLKGNYFEPTILINITKDMKVWKEEVFGPILPIVKYSSLDEAIELGNDTIYGLGGYVFTTNKDTFSKISRELKTGMVSCNNLIYVIPNNPFGGVKKSGLGRNHGKYGFHELCNIKVITFEKP